MINGIDGCKKGWFVFSLLKDDYTFKIIESLEEIRTFLTTSKINFIDIPIGLEDVNNSRECDNILKKILKKRSSSIFNAPIYSLLEAKDYFEACILSQKINGKKISIQTWNIFPKIRDANNFVRRSTNKEILKEFHPETGFLILNNYVPLIFKKKEQVGINERLNILNKFIKAEGIFNEICSKTLRKNVAKDDIVDAMCCAVNAKYATKCRSVPEIPQFDKYGLKKEIIITEFNNLI